VGDVRAVAGAEVGAGQQQLQLVRGGGAFGSSGVPPNTEKLISSTDGQKQQQSQSGPSSLATLVSIDAAEGVRAVVAAAAASGGSSSRRSGAGGPPALAPIQELESLTAGGTELLLPKPSGEAAAADGVERIQPPPAQAAGGGKDSKSRDEEVSAIAAQSGTSAETDGLGSVTPLKEAPSSAGGNVSSAGGHHADLEVNEQQQQQGGLLLSTPRSTRRSSSARESRTGGDTPGGSRRTSLERGTGRTPRERVSADGAGRTPSDRRVGRGLSGVASEQSSGSGGSILHGVQSEPSSPRGSIIGGGSSRGILGGHSSRGLQRSVGNSGGGEGGQGRDEVLIGREVAKVVTMMVDTLVLESTNS
jgi:hypothetical protein